MEPGALFLILALALVVGIFISQPFLNKKTTVNAARTDLSLALDHQRSALLAEHDRLLSALQDLEFDRQLGKVTEEDYPARRMTLVQAAAQVLRDLDGLGLKPTAAAPAQPKAQAADGSDADLEALIAARRRVKQEKTGGFCPKCGKPVLKTDRFCSHCGASL